MKISDPIERIVADGLTKAGIHFKHEGEHSGPPLDFYLPTQNLYIEVKQFHSDRISRQMASAPNVIAIQGKAAALAFAEMINPRTTE